MTETKFYQTNTQSTSHSSIRMPVAVAAVAAAIWICSCPKVAATSIVTAAKNNSPEPWVVEGNLGGIKNEIKTYNGNTFIMRNIAMINKRDDNFAKLKQIQQLEYNWNGNQATPISPNIIRYVESLLHVLNQQPDVYPTARNSILMEYENHNLDYMSFEIFDAEKVKVFTYFEKKESKTEYVNKNDANITEKLNRMVAEFYERDKRSIYDT